MATDLRDLIVIVDGARRVIHERHDEISRRVNRAGDTPAQQEQWWRDSEHLFRINSLDRDVMSILYRQTYIEDLLSTPLDALRWTEAAKLANRLIKSAFCKLGYFFRALNKFPDAELAAQIWQTFAVIAEEAKER